MTLPELVRVELPILQELEALGGIDQLRHLYERLVPYFPQLEIHEPASTTPEMRRRWQELVQRAGRALSDKGELERDRARWKLTSRGRRRLEAEALRFDPPGMSSSPGASTPGSVTPGSGPRSHKAVQEMLVALGRLLGRHAEAEFEFYDVVWRDSPSSPRLSHIFEVQIHGSVEAALTRLKQGYDAQRSLPFLVVADERATAVAARRLSGSFHELQPVLTLIGVGELERLFRSVEPQDALLRKLAAKH